eukprot:TRINITY_DN5667_c0_g1_i1.p2 TRINITY_DN5667_c0_g1~~TRINITY_DN5667_c0_g1_i1.p2  ORF type:complete len:209 (+),score=85.11 TRINITY_DN5667_c0_g1_i1:77-703(+)
MAEEGEAPDKTATINAAVSGCLAKLREWDETAHASEFGGFNAAELPEEVGEEIVKEVAAMFESGGDGGRGAVLAAWAAQGGVAAAVRLFDFIDAKVAHHEKLKLPVLELLRLADHAFLRTPALVDQLLEDEGAAAGAASVVGRLLQYLEDAIDTPTPDAREECVACLDTLVAVVTEPRTRALFKQLGGASIVLDAVAAYELNPCVLPF